MSESYYDNVLEALNYLRSAAGDFRPKTALVLGSGLGTLSGAVENPQVLNTKDIPYWPRSTAPGHAGQIVLGKIEGRPVALLKGRVHYYEGYNMREVTFSTRVLGMWGVAQYIGTNAAGGVDASYRSGDIVLVRDHINYMGANPLMGLAEPRWNVRFPDMTHAYSQRLIDLCESVALSEDIHVSQGVYIAFSGPSYETPAEIRMARALGASLVGMSTVPEVIISSAMGMETAVISCVSNPAAGMSDEELTEKEVLSVVKDACCRVEKLIRGLMRGLEEKAL
ncbi:MAG: purine-nucleoside phosphorylase [Synergistaceae bacterium]|jgi:purine-nucleoside phosphorylase|nr:purine-nucleoside phosphorylase [Synergistaceae bacterium]